MICSVVPSTASWIAGRARTPGEIKARIGGEQRQEVGDRLAGALPASPAQPEAFSAAPLDPPPRAIAQQEERTRPALRRHLEIETAGDDPGPRQRRWAASTATRCSISRSKVRALGGLQLGQHRVEHQRRARSEERHGLLREGVAEARPRSPPTGEPLAPGREAFVREARGEARRRGSRSRSEGARPDRRERRGIVPQGQIRRGPQGPRKVALSTSAQSWSSVAIQKRATAGRPAASRASA